MGASHLGSRGGWGRSPSDAGPLPPLLYQGTGSPRAEERGRCRPWSGSSSDPCKAGSTLSTPTMDTSHPALQGTIEGHWGAGVPSPVPVLLVILATFPCLPPSWDTHTWARQVCAVQPPLRAGAGQGMQAHEGERQLSPPLPSTRTPPKLPLPFPFTPMPLFPFRVSDAPWPFSRAPRPCSLSYSGTPQVSCRLSACRWLVCPTGEGPEVVCC